MKLQHKIISGVVALIIGSMVFTACTDEVKFGNSFIEKTPGGTVSLDTVFGSAEYTKQFLVGLYVLQYYGLPFKNATVAPWSCSLIVSIKSNTNSLIRVILSLSCILLSNLLIFSE